jgi:hypothetical protein
MDHHIRQDDKFGRVSITCGVLQGYIQVAVGPHHYPLCRSFSALGLDGWL